VSRFEIEVAITAVMTVDAKDENSARTTAWKNLESKLADARRRSQQQRRTAKSPRQNDGLSSPSRLFAVIADARRRRRAFLSARLVQAAGLRQERPPCRVTTGQRA